MTETELDRLAEIAWAIVPPETTLKRWEDCPVEWRERWRRAIKAIVAGTNEQQNCLTLNRPTV